MAEQEQPERKEQDEQLEKEQLDDLEVREDESEKVKGGAGVGESDNY